MVFPKAVAQEAGLKHQQRSASQTVAQHELAADPVEVDPVGLATRLGGTELGKPDMLPLDAQCITRCCRDLDAGVLGGSVHLLPDPQLSAALGAQCVVIVVLPLDPHQMERIQRAEPSARRGDMGGRPRGHRARTRGVCAIRARDRAWQTCACAGAQHPLRMRGRLMPS